MDPDFEMLSRLRVGNGYDIHRLVEGRRLVLGGVEIPFPKGLQGHSDGDVLLHAICDAICDPERAEGGRFEAPALFFDRVRYLTLTAFWTTDLWR